MKVKESTLSYRARTNHEQEIIDEALRILDSRLTRDCATMTSPRDCADFLCLKLGGEQREVFGVMYLDVRMAVIAFETPFAGTLTQTSVYPREIIKRALELNAAAVVLSHNHPSGVPEPSRADENLTEVLKRALSLIDVRVLDHIVVAGRNSCSFAERGLI